MAEKKSVSLVLGSGGARGYAHIGVIEVLQEQGFEIKAISGSSMGALIGALYACGKLEVYKEWILTLDMLDVAKLLDLSWGNAGIIQGEKVFQVIEEMIGEVAIEELPVSYSAVATDITNQKEVWFQKGRLVDAVRASIAIPTIFTPVKIGTRYLVDGGVVNPIPIAPTISDMTDLTVAVNLDANVLKRYKADIPEPEQKKQQGIQSKFYDLWEQAQELLTPEQSEKSHALNMFDVMGKTIDTMQNTLAQYKMAGYTPDVIIEIPKDACGFYEFNKAYEMIELGRLIAKETLDSFKDQVS
ncbi:MAG: patatin-like phospholipase family protein [Campylobacterota bacterium]|nr:patatin-like phospholipase family protein [Campylobacterota bacterium]